MTHPFSVRFVIPCLLLLIGGPVFAQKQGEPVQAVSKGRDFRLEARYTAGVAQAYEFTETTKVVRTHSDSSKKEYGRTVKHFMTVRCIESLNGLTKLVVNVDSIQYQFTAPGINVEYDSQVDITPKKFVDLNAYIGPLNRTYTLSMNSYGEVTSLEGEQIEFWRDYIAENSAGIDSTTLLVWQQCLADENLIFVGDQQKGIIPGLKVSVDSTWQHKLLLRTNGVLFVDTVRSRFAQYTGGLYVLTTADTLAAASQPLRTFGIDMVAHVLDGKAAVNGELVLRNTGVIEELTLNVNAWYTAKALMEVFREDVSSTYQWKLTGQYQW